MSPAPSRRMLVALAVSVGVHALLWLLVAGASRDVRVPSRASSRATLEWVEVEVTTPPQPVAEAPAPAPEPPHLAERPPSPAEPPPPAKVPPPEPPPTVASAPPPPTPEPSSSVKAPPPESPPALAEAPPEPPPEETRSDPPPPSTPDLPRLATDVPRTDLSTDVPRTDAPRADLFPSAGTPQASRLLLAARSVTAPVDTGDTVAVLDAGVPDPRTPPSPQQLVEDLVAESVGRGKVERGLVHPYFGQLGKALMKAWDADRSVKEHGLQGYFDMGMERSRAYSRIWLERAESYGASGDFAGKGSAEEDRRRPTSTVGDPTLQMRRELRQKMREEFRSTRRATLRVVQDGQGRLLDVQLVSPSHDIDVDKAAVKDVKAAAEKLPPPPPEAVGGRQRITSLWQFELIISISPPVPTFSFEFDEALGFIDTRLPLDRRIYKRVRLLEVR